MASQIITMAAWINQQEPVPTVPSLSMLNSWSADLLKIQITRANSNYTRANEVRARPATVLETTE